MKYKGNSPCNNCPYRTDAPREYWEKSHFNELISEDKEMFGKIYGCHKNDQTICRGYLMDQDRRNFPNLNLRLSLCKHNVTREYLDNLKCDVPLFKSIKEMCKANYPELIK